MFKHALLHIICFIVVLATLGAALAAGLKGNHGEIRGTVTDPSGALIPSAQVVLTGPHGSSQSATGARDGSFRIAPVQPGAYTLVISANGFAATTLENVAVTAGKTLQEKVTLQLPIEEQQVQVKEDIQGVNTSADENASAIVIKGKDLDALSDDPDELQSELTALAGPAAGPNGAQIFIDGFTGGQSPPNLPFAKSASTRIPSRPNMTARLRPHRDPHQARHRQVPRQSAMIMGNDSAFNSLNPFVKEEPPYYTMFLNANAGGALGKKLPGLPASSAATTLRTPSSMPICWTPRPAPITSPRPSPILNRASTSPRDSTFSSAPTTP